jgi:hypothetical protein
VVGARAECSLPPIWWRELLVPFSRFGKEVSVGMLGPDLPAVPFLNEPTTVEWPMYEPEKTVRVFQVEGGRCALHEHPDHMRLIRETDVFVLCNPGFGSAVLEAAWAPTIALLLGAHKPVVCTAHSQHDLERDLTALARLVDATATHPDPEGGEEGGEEGEGESLGNGKGKNLTLLMPPQKNPFHSMHVTVDDKEERKGKAVTCNEYVYCFLAQ